MFFVLRWDHASVAECVSLAATCDPRVRFSCSTPTEARVSLSSLGIGSLFHSRLLCWQYSSCSGELRIRCFPGNSPIRTHRLWGCGFSSSERKSVAFWFRWLGYPICWECCSGASCTPTLAGRTSKDCKRWKYFSGKHGGKLAARIWISTIGIDYNTYAPMVLFIYSKNDWIVDV